MRQKRRNVRVVEDVLGGAAKHDLAEAAAGEGPLQDQIGADVAGLVEDHLGDRGEGDVVELRPVRLSGMAGERAVIAEGLTGGERVIAEGVLKVQPGVKVKPVAPGAQPEAGAKS